MSNIHFDAEDVNLIFEVSRLGVGNMRQLAFTTGNFSSGLTKRVQNLVDAKAVVPFDPNGNDAYCVTANGMISAYLQHAYQKGLEAIQRDVKLKVRGLRLVQRRATYFLLKSKATIVDRLTD